MAIHSVFLPLSPAQAQRQIRHLPNEAGFRYEVIPAHGGCVVAVIQARTESHSPVTALRYLKRARRVMETLGALA